MARLSTHYVVLRCQCLRQDTDSAVAAASLLDPPGAAQDSKFLSHGSHRNCHQPPDLQELQHGGWETHRQSRIGRRPLSVGVLARMVAAGPRGAAREPGLRESRLARPPRARAPSDQCHRSLDTARHRSRRRDRSPAALAPSRSTTFRCCRGSAASRDSPTRAHPDRLDHVA